MDASLHLECNAIKTLIEMLHEAVGNVDDVCGSMSPANMKVQFERKECSKFLDVDASQMQRLPLFGLRKSTRFSQSIGNAFVQINLATFKKVDHGECFEHPSESSSSLISMQHPPYKGTLLDLQCLSKSKVILGSKKKTRQKTREKTKKNTFFLKSAVA